MAKKSKPLAGSAGREKSGAGSPSKSPSVSGGSSGDLERLEKILQLMDSHELAELEWEKGGERLHLKTKAALADAGMAGLISQMMSAPRAQTPHPAMVEHTQASGVPKPGGEQASAKPPAASTNQKQFLSPFVGTFYRAGSPTADPYVREGQAVKRGDVLCIIEAMKLMNEIEAEFPGKILSVLVENGQPVEFGEPLFMIEI